MKKIFEIETTIQKLDEKFLENVLKTVLNDKYFGEFKVKELPLLTAELELPPKLVTAGSKDDRVRTLTVVVNQILEYLKTKDK